MITVQLVGGASLRSGKTPIAGPPAQRHRIALLTLIAAAWPQPVSRDRAMALLWPERDQAAARRLLNLAVHVLRGALGEDAIASTGDGLVLNPGVVDCDLHELRTAIAAGDAERIARLYTGPLLDGFHLPESAEFGFWLDEHRSAIAHAYIGALLALAERHEQAGDVHRWVGISRRLVAAEPTSPVHARTLMRALVAAGDRSGAIQHAAEHAHRLRAELDADPDPDVMALADEIRRSPSRRHQQHQQAGTRPSTVAVLPFLNLDADPDKECFAEGITEDVIAHLSKIRALKVISRASVTPFKSREKGLKEIGATLGTRIVLDGSIRHSTDRVRVVATLIDVETGDSLWTETYDRQLNDIFAVQTDVALQIAAALQAELSREERNRVRKEPTRDVQAYRLLLQGRQWFIQFTPEAMARSIECFGRATTRDPAFALAFAYEAQAYVELAEGGAMAPDAALRHAAAAVETALRIDPDLGNAHCTLAHLKMVREFDWAGAEREFERALELNPGNSDAYDLYGRLCAGLERHDQAIALLERAQELDPLAHRLDIVTAMLRAGRTSEALVRAQEAVEVDPDSDRARATLGWAYFLGGREEDGIAELERAVAAAPGNTLWLGQLGEAYGLHGDTTRAREILRDLDARARQGYVSPYHHAYVHTGLSDAERAMNWLERAVAERTGPTYGIKGSFLFAPLRAHPRFRALMRQMNLE